MTVSSDQVKVWSLQPKQLIRCINFSTGVDCACFIGKDLVIGHMNLLSQVSQKTYKPIMDDSDQEVVTEQMELCSDKLMLRLKKTDERLRQKLVSL